MVSLRTRTPAPGLGYQWGGKVATGGWLLCLLAMAWLGIADHWSGLVMFFSGMALMVLGATAHERQADLDRLQNKRGDGPWLAPAYLSGWVPASSEQFATVEQLADDHDGVAYVHDLGALDRGARAEQAQR